MGAAPLVLVADHDESCRDLITGLFRRIGFETSEATTGPEALELAAGVQPSLVVLDVNLPEVSGYEVCRELRDEYDGQIGIIFVSRERTTPGCSSAPTTTSSSPSTTTSCLLGRALVCAALRRAPIPGSRRRSRSVAR